MVRLSSKDATLLMDVLDQQGLTEEERRRLLVGAGEVVRRIGEALIDPAHVATDPEIREAVESIRRWADGTKEIEEKQQVSA
jgi:hypothetical protein